MDWWGAFNPNTRLPSRSPRIIIIFFIFLTLFDRGAPKGKHSQSIFKVSFGVQMAMSFQSWLWLRIKNNFLQNLFTRGSPKAHEKFRIPYLLCKSGKSLKAKFYNWFKGYLNQTAKFNMILSILMISLKDAASYLRKTLEFMFWELVTKNCKYSYFFNSNL